LLIRIERDGKPQDMKLRPATVADGDVMIGRIGAAPLPDAAWMKQLAFVHQPAVAEAGWKPAQDERYRLDEPEVSWPYGDWPGVAG
jgi:hypothetical protein